MTFLANINGRSFGTSEADIDIDFQAAARPSLTTSILSRCLREQQGHDIEENVLWDWEIGQRIGALLWIAAQNSRKIFTLQPCCRSCQEPMEISLSVDELLSLQDQAKSLPRSIVLDEGVIHFRLPTGRDQLRWSSLGITDRKELLRDLLENLVTDTDLARFQEADLHGKLETKLGETDPLVDFEISCTCPVCSAENSYSLDLEREALLLLEREQNKLIQQVEQLASRFHWTESEILALPSWRRERYLTEAEREEWP
jgi:hypothetical protein